MINIFAREAFLNINPHEPFRVRTKPLKKGVGHLQRVSSMIRGDQIAEKIGARFNPKEVGIDDVNIYVKPRVQKGNDFDFPHLAKKNYIDIIDGHTLGQLLLKHPEVGCIVCSRSDEKIMKRSIPNEVVYIPQQHCNFERIQRTRTAITRVGVIGTDWAFQFLPNNLEEELNKRGIELVKYSQFHSRQDIIDFYMSIDVQIVWRPYKKRLSNPLKIVNAASFGIPTIALDEPAFEEVGSCYASVKNLKELLTELDEMILHPAYYHLLRENCEEDSEFYHIDNVAKMYKELDK